MCSIYPADRCHKLWLKRLLLFISSALLLLAFLCLVQSARVAAAPAAFDCTTVSEIPQGECNALVALYSSTNGVNWITHTNWLNTNTPCSWYGITCSAGQVQRLELGANRLTGTIPPELGNLAQLQVLWLNSNQLSGTIPPELGNLLQLQSLNLFGNQLSGSIPSQLGNLTQLLSLDLSASQLSGSIPPQLGNLTQLQVLDLQSNQLSGSIPPELGNLAQLRSLYLSGNQLSSSIPSQLGNLAQLRSLYLSDNQLGGSIPPELGNLAQLHILWSSSNQLSGSIPSQLGNLTQLQELHLQYNQLSGSIPPQLGNLTQLHLLDIGYNMLSATDPAVITFLANHNPDWAATQTVPPADLQLVNQTATSVTLIWTPIPYQADGGGYEVGYATQPGGPYTVHGITNDKSANTYTVNGLRPGQTYYFAVRTYTPAHRFNTNSLRSVFSSEQSASLTISLLSLYALALDSDLSTEAEALINGLQSATATDANKVALLLVDRDGDSDTQILLVYGGKVEPVIGLPDPTTGQLNPALHEYNMADGAQLGAFLKWARIAYPAPQTTLAFIGHGLPLAPAIDISPYISPTLATAAGHSDIRKLGPPSRVDMNPGRLTDQHPKALISPYMLAEALRIGTNNGANPLTVLDIVHCFGGTIEEFYELANPGGAPFAQVMIGSPNYAYSGATLLNRALLAIQPGQAAPTLATAIIQAYNAALDEADKSDPQPNVVNHPRVLVAVESSKLAAIKQVVDALAAALLQSLNGSPAATNDTKTKIALAQQNSQKYDTTMCDTPDRKQDWRLDDEDALSDLADFALQLRNQFDPTSTIYLAASDLLTQTNAAVIGVPIRVAGTPWFASDPKPLWAFHSNTSGIALYTDFHGISIKGVTFLGWQAHWYNKGDADNPHPYAFVQGTQPTWADVFQRFWQDRGNGVETIACAAKFPTVRLFQKLYLPVLQR